MIARIRTIGRSVISWIRVGNLLSPCSYRVGEKDIDLRVYSKVKKDPRRRDKYSSFHCLYSTLFPLVHVEDLSKVNDGARIVKAIRSSRVGL